MLLYFTNEEIETERLSDLSKVTPLLCGALALESTVLTAITAGPFRISLHCPMFYASYELAFSFLTTLLAPN